VIELATRRVHIAGIIADPHGGWMHQIARNLTDAVDGFLLGQRYLIMDRDPLLRRAFCETMKAAGVKSVRLPLDTPSKPGQQQTSREPGAACRAVGDVTAAAIAAHHHLELFDVAEPGRQRRGLAIGVRDHDVDITGDVRRCRGRQRAGIDEDDIGRGHAIEGEREPGDEIASGDGDRRAA
jgi:hypothetical protein